MIKRKTFARAKVREIAAKLGLRDAAVYYYFPGKQALAFACHTRYLERFERLLHQAELMPSDGQERVRFVVRELLLDRDRLGPRLYLGEYSYLEAQERSIVASWQNRLETRFQGLIEGGVADGSLRPCDPTVVVRLVLGILATLSDWVEEADSPGEELLSSIDAFMMSGLEIK